MKRANNEAIDKSCCAEGSSTVFENSPANSVNLSRFTCRIFGKLNEQITQMYAMKLVEFIRKYDDTDGEETNAHREGNAPPS